VSVAILGLCLLAYFFFLIAGSLSVWTWVVNQWYHGQVVLPQRESIPVRWGLAHVLGGTIGAVVLIVMFQGGIEYLLQVPNDIEVNNQPLYRYKAAIYGQTLAQILVCSLMAISIFQCEPKEAGTAWRNILADIKLGAITFVALCFPVLVLQALLSQLVPYRHPLIDMLLTDPQADILVPVMFSAVIVAPLTEEFAFRLILQGWLEDLFRGKLNGIWQVFFGWQTSEMPLPDQQPEEDTTEPSEAQTITPIESSSNPFLSSTSSETQMEASVAGESATRWFPILVSAALFAFLHIGQGLGPVALFPLAIGLGYVYQKTRSVVACITVHMMLNGQSMILVLVAIFSGDDV